MAAAERSIARTRPVTRPPALLAIQVREQLERELHDGRNAHAHGGEAERMIRGLPISRTKVRPSR